jgi:hypothetical protein
VAMMYILYQLKQANFKERDHSTKPFVKYLKSVANTEQMGWSVKSMVETYSGKTDQKACS